MIFFGCTNDLRQGKATHQKNIPLHIDSDRPSATTIWHHAFDGDDPWSMRPWLWPDVHLFLFGVYCLQTGCVRCFFLSVNFRTKTCLGHHAFDGAKRKHRRPEVQLLAPCSGVDKHARLTGFRPRVFPCKVCVLA